jgi:hypothetical protein
VSGSISGIGCKGARVKMSTTPPPPPAPALTPPLSPQQQSSRQQGVAVEAPGAPAPAFNLSTVRVTDMGSNVTHEFVVPGPGILPVYGIQRTFQLSNIHLEGSNAILPYGPDGCCYAVPFASGAEVRIWGDSAPAAQMPATVADIAQVNDTLKSIQQGAAPWLRPACIGHRAGPPRPPSLHLPVHAQPSCWSACQARWRRMSFLCLHAKLCMSSVRQCAAVCGSAEPTRTPTAGSRRTARVARCCAVRSSTRVSSRA